MTFTALSTSESLGAIIGNSLLRVAHRLLSSSEHVRWGEAFQKIGWHSSQPFSIWASVVRDGACQTHAARWAGLWPVRWPWKDPKLARAPSIANDHSCRQLLVAWPIENLAPPYLRRTVLPGSQCRLGRLYKANGAEVWWASCEAGQNIARNPEHRLSTIVRMVEW